MQDRLLRLAALTGGANDPSSRFRVRQLIPALRRHGVFMSEFIPAISRYPPAARALRPFWLPAALAARIPAMLATRRFEMTFLQKEMVSSLYTIERYLRKPVVLDVDDAIFLRREGRAARRLARAAALVVCGNDFLADHFSRWNPSVAVIPTAVDVERFRPGGGPLPGRPVIGWIGTSSNHRYLFDIEPALREVLSRVPQARLRVVSDACPAFERLPADRVDWIAWSEETEVRLLQDLAVGIMPLADTPWERGKCSYKMLLYMACGVPVVVSPVGMNAAVLALGRVGAAAASLDEWTEALTEILSDPARRSLYAAEGRAVVERHFGIDRIAPLLAARLKETAA